jgi:pimeloyl-ACP methyl ester carboxylesterase
MFLHALPLDGSMWRNQLDLFPAATYAPTLYHCGPSIQDWAAEALNLVKEEKVIVVGCSIGGSCALEIAKMAPERVESIVLMGTKAQRNASPEFLASALGLFNSKGKRAAWDTYWKPLFSRNHSRSALEAAKEAFDRRTIDDLTAGTKAFHTRPSRQDLLKSYPGHITFVTGALDIAPGVKTTREQSQIARQSSCHIIPDCGHYVPLEAPDELNAILEQRLSGHFSKNAESL